MIIVYTGDGKGKTCACIGQAFRALGRGLSVGFAQFIKRDGIAGEQAILARMPGGLLHFRAGGIGFFQMESEREEHRRKALELLEWCLCLSVDMLILDEAIYALDYGLILADELDPLFSRAANREKHLVLSGRNAPVWMLEKADLVTEMVERRHPHKIGIGPIIGIEY